MNLDSIKKMRFWRMPSARRLPQAEDVAEEVEAEASEAEDPLMERITVHMHMTILVMQIKIFKVRGGEVRNGLISPIANATIARNMAIMLENAERG
jgi:hypothetical protein